MSDDESILDRLDRAPADWGVRILAIEEAIRGGNLDGAKRLVRDSPSDAPTPDEIRIRVHALLTQGVAALESEPASEESSVKAPPEPPAEEEPTEEPVEFGRSPIPADNSPFDELDGGLGALVECEAFSERGELESTDEPPDNDYSDALRIDTSSGWERWEDYDGELELVGGALPMAQHRASSSADRISSLSLALVVHLVVIVLIGTVVITVAPPPPPQFVVSVPHERETEIEITRLARPTPEIAPAAASARPIDVLSSVSSSTFSVPESEDTDNLLMTDMVAGLQPIGNGMSFSTSSMKGSDISFFGLSGSGKRLVFVIDATPFMLVDEKGGMTAYNNVKEEIGIMLATLNRATQFNILLYDGKRLVAFRDELVSGQPSNLRMAIEWMDPLNRGYDSLGLGWNYPDGIEVMNREDLPIQAIDVAHYTKAIQKALEWHASSVFCISSGFRRMTRSPTPEMLEEMEEDPPDPGEPGEVDPDDQEEWDEAVAETREWLQKENDARRAKGVDLKVVTNFRQLIKEVTGVSPPRRTGGTPRDTRYDVPDASPDDIEEQIKQVVKQEYKVAGREEPSVHMVLFLGDEERLDDREDHFRDLTRQNRGKLKVLRGLSALENVTGRR